MLLQVNLFDNCFVDACGSSLLCILVVCSSTFWPPGRMAGLSSLYGSSCSSWRCQVKWNINLYVYIGKKMLHTVFILLK